MLCYAPRGVPPLITGLTGQRGGFRAGEPDGTDATPQQRIQRSRAARSEHQVRRRGGLHDHGRSS